MDVVVELVCSIEGHVADVALVAADVDVGLSFVGSHAVIGLEDPKNTIVNLLYLDLFVRILKIQL